MTASTAPGTRRPCRACGILLTFAIVEKDDGSHTTVPLDMRAPTYELDETGGTWRRSRALVSHFCTCPNAGEFGKGARGKKA